MQQRKSMREPMARRTARPTPQRQFKRARRKTVLALWVLAAVFVGTGALLAVRLHGYRAAREEYALVQAMAETTAAPVSQAPAIAMDVPAASLAAAITPKPFYSSKVAVLQQDNRDAVAWLDIVGTEIQYPVVQGEDNAYYMTHTFRKKKNASGAIFLDCWNAADFTDFNTVIYGHNMNDGSMFGGLREYRHQSFSDEHPVIEVTLLNKKLRYQVFAAYTAQSEEAADFRGQGCATEEQRSAFILAARKRAEIDSSLTVKRNDRLLTLVTCTSGTHPWYWVVHAVLVEEQTVAE